MADQSTYPATTDGDLRAIAVAAAPTPTGFADYLKLLGDAIAKIETELGVNPSGSEATVAAAIAAAGTGSASSITFDDTVAQLGASNVQAAIVALDALLATAGKGAVQVVAAANSPTAIKSRADYICDGTADQTEINAAIAACYATTGGVVNDSLAPSHGGVVLLMPGTYLCDGPIYMNTAATASVSEILLAGFGGFGWYDQPARIRRVDSVTGTTRLITTDNTNSAKNFALANLEVFDDGSTSTGPLISGNSIQMRYVMAANYATAGGPVVQFDRDLTLYDCAIEGEGVAVKLNPATAQTAGFGILKAERCTLAGFYGSTASAAVIVDQSAFTAPTSNFLVEIRDCFLDAGDTADGALLIKGKAGATGRPIVEITDCDVAGYGTAGGSLNLHDCAQVQVHDNKIWTDAASASALVKLTSVPRGSIRGNVQNPRQGYGFTGRGGHAIWLVDCSDVDVTDNNLTMGYGNQADDTFAGIMVDGNSDRINVCNNTLRRAASGNQPKYGVRIDDTTCEDCVVLDNDLLNSSKAAGTGAPLSDNGTRTITNLATQKAGNWVQDNVAASQAAVALVLLGDAVRTEIPMVRPGSVTGVVVRSNEARTAGTLTVDVTINGTVTSLTAVLDGTNTQGKATTQGIGLDKYAAGDRIGVKVTTDGTWAPTTADIIVEVEIVHDLVGNRVS